MTGRPSAPRPRYGRLAAAGTAVLVTLVALLGAGGVLPTDPPAAVALDTMDAREARPQARLAAEVLPAATPTDAPPPAESGQGRRVVFDIGDQRVWLVDADDEVQRSYLVSGSLTDNLSPGTYEVYSRSRWAVGIDDSGVMQYFVRFTRGANAAIGFHSIPTKDGRALQTTEQLGTPQSHGCIRQQMADAQVLWRFAPMGTEVVVTA